MLGALDCPGWVEASTPAVRAWIDPMVEVMVSSKNPLAREGYCVIAATTASTSAAHAAPATTAGKLAPHRLEQQEGSYAQHSNRTPRAPDRVVQAGGHGLDDVVERGHEIGRVSHLVVQAVGRRGEPRRDTTGSTLPIMVSVDALHVAH